eukprot:TRINITY_DN2077_c0_g2_i1.p1 TRINITY_DN2077_c0_g2~~TRINITY_DN2077_c0_g2_i1.p1  ORF type:complete len:126 (+),score=23.33 TRINITY_DN2077_c0_g2_i1:246-623(+)
MHPDQEHNFPYFPSFSLKKTHLHSVSSCGLGVYSHFVENCKENELTNFRRHMHALMYLPHGCKMTPMKIMSIVTLKIFSSCNHEEDTSMHAYGAGNLLIRFPCNSPQSVNRHPNHKKTQSASVSF